MATKYIWWDHARKMVRKYPLNLERYNDAVSPSVSPNLSGMPHSGNISDQTGDTVAQMERKEWYREYKAVDAALSLYRARPFGKEFVAFVRLYYWGEHRRKLADIADEIHVSADTIRLWNRLLLREVGRQRDWM